MLNLASFVSNHARYEPRNVAMRMGDQPYSYADIGAASSQIANYLVSVGVNPGDKVALSCPNVPYFPMVYYGILKAGAVVVPLNVLLKAKEIAYFLNDADVKVFFAFEGTPQLPIGPMAKEAFESVESCETFVWLPANPADASDEAANFRKVFSASKTFATVATQPSDTAVMLYTSGTTGQAKGAELSHFNMVMNALCSSKLFETKGAAKRVFLQVLPLFHSFGQTCGMNATFYAGGEIILLPRFEPHAAVAAIIKHKVTTFAGVPTMYWALFNELQKASPEIISQLQTNLKLCVSGGSSLPVELLRKFESLLEVAIIEGYGLSETSPVASFNHATRERKPGSVGQAIFGVEIRILRPDGTDADVNELGEIVIRGHNIMKGYYKRPEASQEVLKDGWFHTGDLGKMDAEGYVYIVDRLKDMIIRSGFNVYPREVEEILMTHPDVSLVAVVGIPSEEHGEEIRAYIVPKAGATPTAEAIREWSSQQMAAYKYPRDIVFESSLPMTATGKILKRELRRA
jgi:long-chain acyl-CoA synthetase